MGWMDRSHLCLVLGWVAPGQHSSHLRGRVGCNEASAADGWMDGEKGRSIFNFNSERNVRLPTTRASYRPHSSSPPPNA
ncbi:hypothetical protein FA13DRAFT_1744005 [Coprinellus micaceus]|uniref:Uncharacterized protein n=1 Tax=Coprinellus micaceus TaxID=71717 RepID=A0A4Y7SFA1_COPMI|nr:hypothetical protein FA13DRAFT_1744005 [Coprinellus micaceus]